MRRGSRMLALSWVLLSACSNEGSDTKIMVVVWSDLSVPTEMDSIRVDVDGSSQLPSVIYPLTASNDGGKTKLPVVMELVSPDNNGVACVVVATGLLNSNAVVAQTVRLSFDPGHSRVLTLFLDQACKDATSGPCTQPINVNVSNLPEYVPTKPFLAPDASPGAQGETDGSPGETGGLDLLVDARHIVDAAPGNLAADARQIGDVASDKLVPDAGTEMPIDVPLGLDTSSDAPSDAHVGDEAAVVPDGASTCGLSTSPCTQNDGAVDNFVIAFDAGSDARGDVPKSGDAASDTPPDRAAPDASSDAPPDLPAPADSGRDLAVPDSTSACVLPMTTCAGVCINPQTSVGNCGGCGRACGTQNGTPSCAASACSMASCSPGFLDCSADENTSRDGCETNGNRDSANCGRCGNVCTSKVCRNQTCLATARYGNTGSGTATSPFEGNFLAGIQVYIPNASTVTGFGAVLYNSTANCNMVLGLYKDVAGIPGDLVATFSPPVLVTPGGKEMSVTPPVDVLAGTYWILGVWDGLATFSSNSTTPVTWRYASYPFGALPATAPTSTTPTSLPPPNLYVIVAQ